MFSGSHDAMSYCLDITSPLLRSESDTFRLLDGVFCCLTRPAIYRWATTQAGIYLKFVDYFDCLKCLIFHSRDTSVCPIALIVSVFLMCKFRHFYMCICNTISKSLIVLRAGARHSGATHSRHSIL